MTIDKELKSKYNKIYYQKHRDYVIEHLKELRYCECCNQSYHLYQISKHKKTLKHIINNNNYNNHIKNCCTNNMINNNAEGKAEIQ